MRIAIVNEAYFKDTGIPTHIRAYVSELTRLGNNVSIFATDTKESDNNELLSFITVRKTHRALFKMLLFFRAIRTYLKTNKVDVIHVHDSVAFMSCWLAGKIYKIPVVATCHGTVYQRNIAIDYRLRLKVLYKITDRLVALLSTRIVAISKEVRDVLIKIGAKDTSIIIIPGIYEKAVFSIVDKPKEFTSGKKTCLFVGALRPIKGVEHLIDAIPEVVRTIKNIELLLIGPGECDYKKKVLSKIDTLGMAQYIKYIGHVTKKELPDYYRKADLFILPSINEPQGLVVLEAMSFALPVVASNVGGIPDMINDGVNGLLIPSGDAIATAQAIIKILSDKLVYEVCSRGAWAYMKNDPSGKRVIDLISLYEDVLQCAR